MNEKINPLKRQIIIFTVATLVLFIAGISINNKRVNKDSELIRNKKQAQIVDSIQIIQNKIDSFENLKPRKLAKLKVNDKSVYIISESVNGSYHLIYVFNSKRNVYEKISLEKYDLRIIDTILEPTITGLKYDDENHLVLSYSNYRQKYNRPIIHARIDNISLYINPQLTINKR